MQYHGDVVLRSSTNRTLILYKKNLIISIKIYRFLLQKLTKKIYNFFVTVAFLDNESGL